MPPPAPELITKNISMKMNGSKEWGTMKPDYAKVGMVKGTDAFNLSVHEGS